MDFSDYTRREKRLSIYLIAVIILALAVITSSRFGGMKERLIDGDGKGYYAYLPAVFIHHTLDFTPVYDFEKDFLSKDYLGHYFIDHKDIKINKYYSGVALLMLPFFLLALFFTWIFGLEMTGYSMLFQYFILLGSICYGFHGSYFTYRLLRSFSFPERKSFIAIIILITGTNLFYYIFLNPAASHVYSFFAASLFLYFSRKALLKFTTRNCMISSIALGLIVLIRPVNGLIILLIPFLATDSRNLLNTISLWIRSGRTLLFSVLVFLLIISIQFLIFYLQTGELYIWTYQGEGFRFNAPEITNFLFSYRKGFFIYTPVMLLAILGMIPLLRKSLYQFFNAFIFLTLVFYVLSSWWSWFYGDSFGMRPLIDFYPFLAILLAFFLTWFRNRIYSYLLGIIFFILIIFNLFQIYQYEHRIITHDSMTGEKYWYVFMKGGEDFKDLLSGNKEGQFEELNSAPSRQYHIDFDTLYDGWIVNAIKKVIDTAYSGDYVCPFDSAIIYNAGIKITSDSLFVGDEPIFVRCVLQRYDLTPDASLKLTFVAQVIDQSGNTDFYKTFRFAEMPSDTSHLWIADTIEFKLPKMNNLRDELSFYLWNQEQQTFFVDDVEIGFYEFVDKK